MTQAKLIEIDSNIRKGNLENAQEALMRLTPELNSEKRYRSHLEGKIHFMRGNYSLALRFFENTIHQFGYHLGPLCDLTFSLMLIGDYSKAKHWFEIIKTEYRQAKPQITQETSSKRFF